MHTILEWLNLHPLLWPVFIFFARITDVSIGTLRTVLLVRGSRVLAPVLGFFEVLIWVTAISGVLTHLSHWYNVVSYAAGFATGNAVGMWIERRLALGMQAVQMISRTRSAAVAEGLRLAGYGVTELKGRGMSGEVSVSLVIVPRRDTRTAIGVAQSIDPDVCCTVEDVRSTNIHTYRGAVAPSGWRAILKRK